MIDDGDIFDSFSSVVDTDADILVGSGPVDAVDFESINILLTNLLDHSTFIVGTIQFALVVFSFVLVWRLFRIFF